MKWISIGTVVISVLILFGGVFVFTKKDSGAGAPEVLSQEDYRAPELTSHEYYYRDDCPHCANVAEFMDGWEDKDKLELKKSEITQDFEGHRTMLARAEACGIPLQQTGVPFLVTPEGECILGDAPIIDYFSSMSFEE